MISLDYQIRNALIELQEWANVSTPEDIEKFYREGFPYYHSAFSILDADNFLFITNEIHGVLSLFFAITKTNVV